MIAALLGLSAVAIAGRAAPDAQDARRLAGVMEAVRQDSRLQMFYLSAPDCSYCRQWESRARVELLSWSAGKALGIVEIRGETLRLPITAQHYPPEYRWVYEQIGPSRGVPRFLLAVDGRVVLSAFGTARYDEVFLPALKGVVARRASTL